MAGQVSIARVDVIENFPHSHTHFGGREKLRTLIVSRDTLLPDRHFCGSSEACERNCEESSPLILAYFFRLSAEMGEKRPPTRIATSVSGEYLSRVSGLGGDDTTSGQMQSGKCAQRIISLCARELKIKSSVKCYNRFSFA